MHFSRSLAGVALRRLCCHGFCRRSDGRACTIRQSAITQVTSPTGREASGAEVGRMALSPVGGRRRRRIRTRPSSRPTRRKPARRQHRPTFRRSRRRRLSYKAPSGVNATAAATADQPVTLKNPAVLSKTGVNAGSRTSSVAMSSSRPTRSLCAGAGFVVQVVNSQVQISDANLNKRRRPSRWSRSSVTSPTACSTRCARTTTRRVAST